MKDANELKVGDCFVVTSEAMKEWRYSVEDEPVAVTCIVLTELYDDKYCDIIFVKSDRSFDICDYYSVDYFLDEKYWIKI